jgi:sulfate adenylyltransferase
MSKLVDAHGGTLIDRIVPEKDVQALQKRAETLPKLTMDAREVADVELIAIGAASPLTGFQGKADYESVVHNMKLANGTIWSLPFTLAVEKGLAEQALKAKGAGLYDANGRLWAVINVTEIFERDPLVESKHVYKTEEDAHPGVAYLKGRPTTLVAGSIDVLPLPTDLPFAKYRKTPREMRAEIEKRGWKRIAGFQTRNPIHRAHEHLTKLGLEFADGLVIHPLVGETKGDDVPAAVRFQVYEALVDKYYPKDRTILAAFPAAMRYAGPREAIWHIIARKNYGITSVIIGRDHAGVGKYYGSLEAQQLVDTVDLGVSPLKLDPTFFCHACKSLASLRTCPHDASQRLELSGTKVRETLKAGGHLPEEFTRPEIAEILRAAYSGNGDAKPEHHLSGAARAATSAVKPKNGFILWFTGLSGAGKSTLAEAVTKRLANHLHFQILDGDDVRTYLSKGPRLLEGRPRHEHPAHRLRGAAHREERHARHHRRHLAVQGRPGRDPRAGAEGGHGVRRGLREGRDRSPDRARREGPLQEGDRRRDQELHRRLGSVRGSGEPGRARPLRPRVGRGEPRQDPEGAGRSRPRAGHGGPRAGGGSRNRLAFTMNPPRLLPVFLKLTGRKVVVVGGGRVAAGKLPALREARAEVLVVSPEVVREIAGPGVRVEKREFQPEDLDGAWYVVAAATPAVNRQVAAAAEDRRIFINAVDDKDNATAYLGGVLSRGGVMVAFSTSGEAPGLAGLLREAIDAMLPEDLERWVAEAEALRVEWKAAGVPMEQRRPLLLQALNRIYDKTPV